MCVPVFCWLLHCNTLQLGAAATYAICAEPIFLLSSYCLAVMLCMSRWFVMGSVTILEQLLFDEPAKCQQQGI